MNLKFSRLLNFAAMLGFVFIAACGGSGGGGGNQQPADGLSDAPMAALKAMPKLSLSLDSSAGRSDSVYTLDWKITNAQASEGMQLQIRCVEPASARETGRQSVQQTARVSHGSLPALGAAHYLSETGDWNSEASAYGAFSLEGETSFSLPGSTGGENEGEWRIEASLSEGGYVLAESSLSLLVSDFPAIYLSVNRSIANPDDAVRAVLSTASGVDPVDVTLAAMLTLPDGSVVSLPNFSEDIGFVHEGLSADSEFALLDKPLYEEGEGSYRLTAQLMDSETGETMAFAEAEWEVCSDKVEVSGAVYDNAGQPVDGSSAAVAEVVAFDVDDGGFTEAAAIGADGSYLLSLSPGRYVMWATVVGDETISRIFADDLLYADCGDAQTGLTLNLGNAPLGRTAARTSPNSSNEASRETKRTAHAPTPCQPLPPVLVLVRHFPEDLPSSLQNNADQMYYKFLSTMRAKTSNVRYFTEADLQNVLSYSSLSATDQAAINQLRSGAQFTVDVLYDGNESDGITGFLAYLSDFVNGDFPREVELNITPNMSVQNLRAQAADAAETMAEGASGSDPFETLLNSLRIRPVEPRFDLTFSPAGPYEINETFQVTGILTDMDCTPVVGEELQYNQLQISAPVLHGSGITDSAGKASWSLSSGHNYGVGNMQLGYPIGGNPNNVEFTPLWDYRVLEPTDFRITSATTSIEAMDFGEACVEIFQGVGAAAIPMAGQIVDLTAVNATLSTAQVTTAIDGTACFDFAAGNSRGIGKIVGAWDDGTTVRTAALRFLVGGPVQLILTASPVKVDNGSFSVLSAVADLGAADASGVFVSITQNGDGSLIPGAGFTDAYGVFKSRFAPPDDGDGSTIFTATITVDGNIYTDQVEIEWGKTPPPPEDKIVYAYHPGTTGGEWGIYSIDPDGSNQSAKLATGMEPAWSPDGEKIAFVNTPPPDGNHIEMSNEIYVVNADGSNVSRLTTDQLGANSPAWSPDGSKIAFSASNADHSNQEIYVMGADGSSVTNLTNGSALNPKNPTWSPDGAKIAFSAGSTKTIGIYTVSSSGGSAQKIAGGRFYEPDWSPDGSKIVCTDWVNNHKIVILDLNGSGQTDTGAAGISPVWSPDGTKIAYGGEQLDAVYIMNADGSNHTQLTTGAWPDWRPY